MSRTQRQAIDKTKWPIVVHVYEYERGYGRRLFDSVFFKDPAKAKAYQVDYNKGNTAKVVPDCYFAADEPQVNIYRGNKC